MDDHDIADTRHADAAYAAQFDRAPRRVTYRVVVKKRRTGEIVKGTMTDDGLQSLWPVTCEDGSTAYVSELDTFIEQVPVTR